MERDMAVRNKRVLITGSARGIGKEMAILFAREGADIVLNDIVPERQIDTETPLRYLFEMIKGTGRRCIYVYADVSKHGDVTRLAEKVVSEFGGIDILINNAAISPKKEGRKVPILELDEREWEEVFAINIGGVFLCSKLLLPYMIQNRYGRIINISSMDGKTGGFYSVSAHYAASKAAVIAFTKTLAREVAPYGINVNCIAPGCIATEMLLNRPKEILESYIQHIPLGRIGKASEVASVALFLSSEASSYMTGTTIDVNGGWIMD
jgi:3-oxoacyl-[acyl-carrier protein] reductase